MQDGVGVHFRVIRMLILGIEYPWNFLAGSTMGPGTRNSLLLAGFYACICLSSIGLVKLSMLIVLNSYFFVMWRRWRSYYYFPQRCVISKDLHSIKPDFVCSHAGNDQGQPLFAFRYYPTRMSIDRKAAPVFSQQGARPLVA